MRRRLFFLAKNNRREGSVENITLTSIKQIRENYRKLLQLILEITQSMIKKKLRYLAIETFKPSKTYPASSGFSRPDAALWRERNHCERPYALPLSMRVHVAPTSKRQTTPLPVVSWEQSWRVRACRARPEKGTQNVTPKVNSPSFTLFNLSNVSNFSVV